MVESIASACAAAGRRLARGRHGALAATGLCALLMSGCGSFFAKNTTTTTGGSGTTTNTTGDYLYVANSSTSLNTVTGYSLASGALSSTASSPYQISAVPTALAITPSNSLLFVGSVEGGIYAYAVGSNGALTLNNGGVVASIPPTSMAVDPTGNWLLAIQDNGTAPLLSVFSINTTTGALTTKSTISLDPGSSGNLLFVPNTSLVYASLGTGGVDALSFNTSTGVLTKLSILLSTRGSAYADNGLASDPEGQYLFVAETGTNGIRSLAINSDGTLSELSGSPVSAGSGVGSVLVDATGSFLYATNLYDNTVSAYTITSGSLAEIAGSPFATGSRPESLAEDNTKGYLEVVCSGGSPDLQLFTIAASTGVLTSAISQATGRVSPAGAYAVVASH